VLSLFDKAGLMLKPNETVVKTGKCSGKVPKERGQKMTGGLLSVHFAQKVEWEDVDGELVLTNQRLFVIGEKGRMRKDVIPFLDLELAKVTAVCTAKGLMGKEKLLMSLDLGTGKPERTEFDVDEPINWVTSIRGQIGHPTQQQPPQSQQPQQPVIRQAAQFCINCGVSLPLGSKFCSHCGSAQT
jgi:hypothetical protein